MKLYTWVRCLVCKELFDYTKAEDKIVFHIHQHLCKNFKPDLDIVREPGITIDIDSTDTPEEVSKKTEGAINKTPAKVAHY